MNIIIIGATSGIGKAIYEFYATKDNLIAIVGRRTHLLEKLRQNNPSHTITATADITDLSETEKSLDYLCREIPQIDLAIVCSGTGDINKSLDYSKERPTIETNITGWTFVVDQLYRKFEKQGYGHLVAISSVGGLRGEPNAPAYSASKAYQINYMESLRKKAFKNGGQIIVTDIRPGLADTAMAKGEGLFWVMPVEKVARQICKAISRQKSKAYITRRWHLLAIIIKNMPFAWYKRI
ncbi:MAG: SDR family NAD(P)-dependent oxidoreductase [Bacteroidaceae bacterium]|nr:SDR family NAD(P)-dependent oxidoreductase [Bacteroidaceae bacterium]